MLSVCVHAVKRVSRISRNKWVSSPRCAARSERSSFRVSNWPTGRAVLRSPSCMYVCLPPCTLLESGAGFSPGNPRTDAIAFRGARGLASCSTNGGREEMALPSSRTALLRLASWFELSLRRCSVTWLSDLRSGINGSWIVWSSLRTLRPVCCRTRHFHTGA